MIRVDTAAFFDAYRKEFRRVSPAQVKPLEELLTFIMNDPYVKDVRHAAYMLATVKLETDDTYRPIHEYGTYGYFENRYGRKTKKGKELGNDDPQLGGGFDGAGSAYAGQGFVQLTGASNFKHAEDEIRKQYPDVVRRFEASTGRMFDLTVGDQPNDKNDPANAMNPEVAYAIMSAGMRQGWFTRKKLSDYINATKTDFYNARRIINGTDRAQTIANYADAFLECFRAATKGAADTATEPVADESASTNAGTEESGIGVSDDGTPQTPPTVVENSATGTSSGTESAGTVIQTPTPTQKQTLGDKIKTSTTFIQNLGLNIGAGITAVFGSLWSVFDNHPDYLLWILGLAAAVAVVSTLGYYVKEAVRIHSEERAKAMIAAASAHEPSPEQLALYKSKWEAEYKAGKPSGS